MTRSCSPLLICRTATSDCWYGEAESAIEEARDFNLCTKLRDYQDALEWIATADPENLKTLDCVKLLARIVRQARAALADGGAK